MFKINRRFEEERQYYEDMLNQAEQRQTVNLLVGLAVGAVAGYCMKKHVIPKLAEIEYKERLSAETELLKERFGDLKQSVLSLKDKFKDKIGDCCCCDDECDDDCCCDDECSDCCCGDDFVADDECCCTENCFQEDDITEEPDVDLEDEVQENLNTGANL